MEKAKGLPETLPFPKGKESCCPWCEESENEDVEGDDIDWSVSPAIHITVRCASCGAEWQEVYNLVGYQNLHPTRGQVSWKS